MLKKCLSVTVSVILVFLMLPISAHAESYVCYIERDDNDQYYHTVKEAAEAAEDGDTIVLVNNSKEAEIYIDKKSLTVKGNGYTIDSTSYKYNQFYNSKNDENQTLTIENTVLKHTTGFLLYPMELKIYGCKIETLSGNGLKYVGKEQNTVPYNVTVENTQWTVNKDSGSKPFCYINNGNANIFGNLTVNNSQIDFYGGSSDENGSMLYCNTTGAFEINIKGGSKLRLCGANGRSFFNVRQETYTLSLDKGSEMVFASDYSNKKLFANKAPNSFTDNGAVFKNEGRADMKLTLPTVDQKGRELIGWSMGERLYSPDTESLTLVAGAALSSVFCGKDDFFMESGASLRNVQGGMGIRFTTLVSNELFSALGENAEYTTYAVPLGEGETDPSGQTAKQKLIFTHENPNGEYAEGKTALHGAIIMNPENVDEKDIYSLSLSARCKMKLFYDGGSELEIYTDFDMNDNTRSMSQTAYNLENDLNISNNVTRHILTVCPYVAE